MVRCTLKDDLLDVQKESPPGSSRYFTPIDHLNRLVTHSKVEIALKNIYQHMAEDSTTLRRYSANIYPQSKRIFAILISGDELFRQAIKKFVDEGVTDEDLPFCRAWEDESEDPFVLCKSKHKDCKATIHRSCGFEVTAAWDKRKRGELDRIQWFFQAPEFRKLPEEIPHFDFHEKFVMPFIKDCEQDPELFRVGGYSEVWPVQIHPAHQNLLSTTDSEVIPSNRKIYR
jgi:hypothetical protein